MMRSCDDSMVPVNPVGLEVLLVLEDNDNHECFELFDLIETMWFCSAS